MRRRLSCACLVLVGCLLSIVPGAARAETAAPSEPDREDDLRPVRYASIEVNPLAAAVDRFGGQGQVAVMGPLTFVLGASRIDARDLRGWAYEVGSRLFFGLEPRRRDGLRLAHAWLAATYLADYVEQQGTRGERRGVAFDVGLHARLRYGFYVLAGVGIAHRSSTLPIAARFERAETTPRLLLSLGWGL
jgi:hypothetical protein